MFEAALWGTVATATLLIGMGLAYTGKVSVRWIGLAMAFGAGAIISAAAYQLVLPALSEGTRGAWVVGAGIAAGALTFYLADRWVDGMGGAERMDMHGEQEGGSGTAILLGSLLDGTPESLVLGLSIAHSPEVSLAFVFAVAISNVPQGLGGTAGMLKAGWSRSRISGLWLAVCAASVIAAVIGYLLGVAVPGLSGSALDAFAAGALLVMLSDSMIPDSFKEGGREAGLALTLGFCVAVAVGLAQAPLGT